MKEKDKTNTSKPMTYKEYYKKYSDKKFAQEILFGWFDYCKKRGIDPRKLRKD